MTKNEFEIFAAENFPNNKIKWGDSWFYIAAHKSLSECYHFEYINGNIVFHIEGSYCDWKTIRKLLYELNSSELTPRKWGRKDCEWVLNHPITNDDDIKIGFLKINNILRPVFNRFINASSNKQEQSDSDVCASFRTVAELMREPLSIPDYQRPYCWTQNNISALLDDINKSRSDGRLTYTIGSVILHRDNDRLNIVDGQQRLTSLILILKNLGYANLPTLKFNHSESFTHIRANHKHIKDWFIHNIPNSDMNDLREYILNSCQMVEIVVSDISEAFQMFETQNGRGKSLLPYNLLKAFHIRAMERSTQEEKITADRNWEAATMENNFDGNNIDILSQLFNEHIYRTRKWVSDGKAFNFTKNNIDEFKGVTIDNEVNINFPYQNQAIQATLAMYALRMMHKGLIKIKSRFRHGDPEKINPFVTICQSFINGQPFFEYIETYVEIYKRLFIQLDSSQLAGFKNFYKEYCLCYPGAWRTGDSYVREAYKSVIMLLFDLFGEEGVEKFYLDIYRCVYYWRLEMRQIRYESMAKYEPIGWLCQLINKAKSLSDMQPIIQRSEIYRNKNYNSETANKYAKIISQFSKKS